LENLAGKEIQKSKKKKQKKNKNKNSLFSSDIVANVRDFCKRQERKKESENVKEKKKKKERTTLLWPTLQEGRLLSIRHAIVTKNMSIVM
jgi:hypothetical protein